MYSCKKIHVKRSELKQLPEYFDRYILKCDDVHITEAIQTSIDEIYKFPVDIWDKLGDTVYAPGKWTVKSILQHLIDTERIFTYRALAFARGEKQRMLSFDEDAYEMISNANKRSLNSLITELMQTHLSFKAMMESFTPEMLERNGMGFKGEYSVASIGFCMPGHQRWHLNILEEKYHPLIK